MTGEGWTGQTRVREETIVAVLITRSPANLLQHLVDVACSQVPTVVFYGRDTGVQHKRTTQEVVSPWCGEGCRVAAILKGAGARMIRG